MRQEHNGSTPGPNHNIATASIVKSEVTSTPARDAVPNEGPPETVTSASRKNELDVEKHTEEPNDVTGAASNASDSDTDADTYPEGGVEAWTVTFGAWCAMVVGLGLVNTISPIQAYLSANQLANYSASSISWIFSIYVFLVFFCGLQIGPVFDAKGPRVLIAVGSVLVVLAMMLLGLCTEYWHFILDFSIIGGIGSSLLFTPAVATISHWFSRRRSTATGLATTGGSIGGVIFPLALQSLIPKVGFAWATRIVGFIFVFFVIFANLLVKGRLAPKNKTRVNDVLPDFRIFLDGTGAFALVTAGTFFMEFGLFVPITYLTSYCIANGVDPTFSYQVIAILNAGSCFGRWLPGLAADRMGRFNIMILTLMLCLITTFAFWLPATYDAVVPLIVVYSVLFGFASGSNISLVPTCVGQLCDTREYGRYYATCYTVVSFSTLTGIPIAGALIDAAGGSYWGVIVFTGLCYVASVMCFVAVRVRKVGWSLRARW